ncbi:MAG: ATP-binding protein [Deltaproteobacteria bacterium]|nr:ATP-binding protein [Deltaproteobacteria bacterium]
MDPQLRELRGLPFTYRYPILAHLPINQPGIYSITGGRRIGKSTVLKQWMCDLLDRGVAPQRIFYVTGELVDDHHALVALLTRGAPDRSPGRPAYLLIDEVTYIRGWDRGVKFLADAGLLEEVVLVLTGSDSVIIHEARTLLPGRRGRAPRVDLHLYPLSFAQYLDVSGVARDLSYPHSPETAEALTGAFLRYLMHGGYLTAINDMAAYGRIEPATFAVYCDWIRGDMAKRGKQEHFLNEILGGVVRRYGSQVTWNNLARDLSIDHPATVADYIALLSRMDVLIVQHAMREDRLTAAPKKARKVAFTDPFIFHAVRSWLDPVEDPFASQVVPALADPGWTGRLAEACAVAHHHRLHPTFYIKGDGEVDIAYVTGGGFQPVEVKWTGQVRSADLKQARKYPNIIVCSKLPTVDRLHGLPNELLPLHLQRLGESPHYVTW